MELERDKRTVINKITRHIPKLVNNDQNATLLRPI